MISGVPSVVYVEGLTAELSPMDITAQLVKVRLLQVVKPSFA